MAIAGNTRSGFLPIDSTVRTSGPRNASLLDVPMSRRELLRLLAGASGSLLLGGCWVHQRNPLAGRPGAVDFIPLQASIRGRVVPFGVVNYESTRRGLAWNGLKPERFPDAIVRVASEADVREAIRFARRRDLKVAIRGGGHNYNNAPIRQGGLVLDLTDLNRLQVDVAHRTAVVQPGVTGAALIAGLAPHGLAFPVGHCPDVGLSGFLLNGGQGWNYRGWGPACASVEAVEIVDARGESIFADRDHDPDLFWAARGAGPGFFGVVTAFHLKLFSLPRAMLRSSLTYRIEDVDKVAAWLVHLLGSPPPEISELWCSCFVADSGERRIRVVAHAFAATVADARTALGIMGTGPAGVDALDKKLAQERPVEAVFGRVSSEVTQGPRYAADCLWSNASLPELLRGARAALVAAPAGCSVFLWFPQGQQRSRPDMAFSMEGTTYVAAYSGWDDATHDGANQAWVRTTIQSLDPLKVGRYVGEADLTVAPDRVSQCFSVSAWDKLIQVKHKYDPDNLFFSYLR